MVTRTPHIVLLAIGAFVLALSCASAENATLFENPCVTYLPGRFSEFLVDADGSVVLFPEAYDGIARIWRDGQWRENTKLAVAGIVRDVVTVGRDRWLVLSQTSEEETILYEYTAGKLRPVGRLTGKFEKPTLHPAPDGRTWITSAEGRAYALKDGKVVTHEFGPEVKKGSCYTYYPPTLSLEVPNRGLWFWSHVEHEALNFGGGDKLAIEGFHVYQNGEWRVVSGGGKPDSDKEADAWAKLGAVSPGGGKLGGAILGDPKTIIAGSRYKGMFSLDTEDSGVRDMDCALPPDEHCLFLHRTSAGHLLLIVARPSMFMRLAPVHGGWLGQLLAIKDGQVRMLLSGVDFKSVFHDKGRPVIDVREGTFLAEAQSGLLFVSANLSAVRRLDWRFGIPVPNIDRMRVLDRQLCVLDRERGFAILDYPRLLRVRESPGSGDWAVFASASAPAISADGSLWYLAASEPAELRHWVGTNETAVSMAGSEFPAKSLWYLTMDTKNRLWLISNFETFRTAFLDNGKWRAFDSRETAYSTVALEEAGHPEYRLGNPSDHCYPAFPGDGRVAYQNEWSSICFFDSDKWDACYGENKIDGRSSEEPPFYNEGILTVRAGDSYYQLVNRKWELTHKTVRSPYGEKPRQNYVDDIPPSFPGDASRCSIRLRDNMGTLWAGDPDNLWRGLNDVWAPFGGANSPLSLASGVRNIQVDGSGCIWFSLGGGNYTRLARYKPKGSLPRVEWVEAPRDETKTGSFKFSLRLTGSGKQYFVRHQVDGGGWRQSISESPAHDVSIENLTNGMHVVRVQVFDDLLRASDVIEHRFAVNRNYEEEIREWIPLLMSSDFSRREKAARMLVGIGLPALPVLTSLEMHADAGTRWWIRAVKEEIERQR